MSGPYTAKLGAGGGGSGPASTDALAEGVTNLYFTAARVRATVLTGLATTTATAILSTDTLLDALGKLQAQINADPEISSINGTVAGSDLTLTLFKRTLAFRNASLTDGNAVVRTMGADITLVIPSGATLGCISAQLSRLYLIALDNAGTVELAVVNSAGGVALDETGLISTTAISTAADSNNVVYSTTARTNVAYRVVGMIECTQATAGTYATAPSLKQGAGGNALTAMNSIGYGQTVIDAVAAFGRALNTTYYNLTGKPIFVNVAGSVTGIGSAIQITVQGKSVYGGSAYTSSAASNVSAIIPPGAPYSVQIPGGGSINTWLELR